ncbi:MAG: FAD-dependent oxidoreductase [Acidobacteria bacterium]|nr:MAG: FAD-dependent oxidoreductase [Acidobacteriota bacterium]
MVIVGAGFGGLYAAQALKRADVRITVIDRRNHHLFQPLLYQVATATLSPSDIAYPIRSVLRSQPNIRVFLAEVSAISVATSTVILEDGELTYDYLILATGACHSYFGHAEWEVFAPGLKSIEDALEIRRRILCAFEKAERETDEAKRRVLLTFVIVGGGPTGVELAGAIAEIACMVMVQDFRVINPREARVILAEAGSQILPSFPADLSAKAEASLTKLCVDVRKNAPVTAIQPGVVVVGDERIPAATVLWAAGVTASPLARSLVAPLDRAGRVLVEPDLSIPGHPDVFVIGDLAAFVYQKGGPLPGLAPVAIQQGRHAAQNILRRCQGLPSTPFRYADRGALATIGRAAAVADFGAVKISGFIAWIAWTFIHIFFLIGFRNRLIVLFEWAWAYVTLQRSARLIIGGSERQSR